MHTVTAREQANQEKNSAAFASVMAAIGLTVFKLVVGIMTNSLGILAEAAHSGLDLVAALVTFFAVRWSGHPADQEHQYGHGKVENLSALFETGLLLLTCVWIIYEALRRLLFQTAIVDATFWAFLVMFVSIGVDISRSRMLSRTAIKYNSQALEADALHFSTDIWSSVVVILGLVGVRLAGQLPALTAFGERRCDRCSGRSRHCHIDQHPPGRACSAGLVRSRSLGLTRAGAGNSPIDCRRRRLPPGEGAHFGSRDVRRFAHNRRSAAIPAARA